MLLGAGGQTKLKCNWTCITSAWEFSLYSLRCEPGSDAVRQLWSQLDPAGDLVSAQRPELVVRLAGIQGGDYSSPRWKWMRRFVSSNTT